MGEAGVGRVWRGLAGASPAITCKTCCARKTVTDGPTDRWNDPPEPLFARCSAQTGSALSGKRADARGPERLACECSASTNMRARTDFALIVRWVLLLGEASFRGPDARREATAQLCP